MFWCKFTHTKLLSFRSNIILWWSCRDHTTWPLWRGQVYCVLYSKGVLREVPLSYHVILCQGSTLLPVLPSKLIEWPAGDYDGLMMSLVHIVLCDYIINVFVTLRLILVQLLQVDHVITYNALIMDNVWTLAIILKCVYAPLVTMANTVNVVST